MSQRRMFSKTIISSASFIKMPQSTQALYFHLAINADDDGIVEAFPVMRMVSASEDDLRVLVAKKFVTVLNEDLVTFINDWLEHNLIRPDRKVDSKYKNLLLQILPEVKLINKRSRCDTLQGVEQKNLRSGPSMSGEWAAQDRLGKDRLGKDSIDNSTNELGYVYKQNNKINTLSNELSKSTDVDIIFDYWRLVFKHSNAKLDKKRATKIKNALKLYALDQVKDAIDGCKLSPFHNGDNDSRVVYDDVTLILRDSTKIEMFIGFKNNPPKNGSIKNANTSPKQRAYQYFDAVEKRCNAILAEKDR